MILNNNNINIRTLNVDIRSEINPTSIVLYQESLDEYKLIFRLIDNGTYFIIPDTTKLTIKINGTEAPATDYCITDKYRGTVHLKLNKSYFMNNEKLINSSIAQMITLEMYSESTFGSHQYTITIPITVVSGTDTGDQNGNAGTTTPDPEVPSPSWNLTQDIKPPIEENPDEDEIERLIFDGGSFF